MLETADRLDFNISRSATALKSGLTYRAAMLMNEDITSWFNNRALAGLDDVMHGAGCDISLFSISIPLRTANGSSPLCRYVAMWMQYSSPSAVDSREVEQLKRIRVPIVGINTPGREDFDATVCIDDDEGMMIATQHLINLGHKYIVYICSRAADSLNASIDARRQVSSMLVRPLRQAMTCTEGA